ncbi:hypothetical protein M9435_006396 [Picochlorum sp. BPE23]|nr:hypothetical protein M9435_006396 [Picochlorum sp. BPE23]
MGSTGVTIEEDAAIRLTLHALKYPRASCNGILLGRIDDGDVIVSEIVPVCHTYTTLPGQMEIALCMVDKACQKSAEQTGIVGYYQCNERLGDLDLGLVGQKIADTISRLISGGKSDGVVLMLDGKALSSLMGIQNTNNKNNNNSSSSSSSSPFVSLKKSQGWVQMERDCIRLPFGKDTLASKLKQLIQERAHEAIVDFEDHMEDITQDWLPKRLLLQ